MARETRSGTDRKLVLWVVGGVLAAIFLFSLFGPAQADDDPRPSTYNSGTRGIKGAFLLLSQLGYGSERATGPETWLATVDASKTTVILTDPVLPVKDLKRLQDALADFMDRGGRVLATGAGGAQLLPDGAAEAPTRVYEGLCYSQPEGTGVLARVGTISTAIPYRWSASGPQFRIQQRCGVDAVVVSMRHGQGEGIWWSSPKPMTNGGMTDDANLKLLLASLGGPGRAVIFDEYLHEKHESIFDTVGGLPWSSLGWQCGIVGLLLVLSFGRRNGPLRTPVTVPRTSPIEFAESMGRLYAGAGATSAAINAAEGRLTAFLRDQCGVPPETLRGSPQAIGQVLGERFNGDWSSLATHLEQAREAANASMIAKSALALVQALERDEQRLREHIKAGRTQALQQV